MRLHTLILSIIIVSLNPVWAQNARQAKRSITLDDAILMARTRSVDAAVALNELKTAYWEYRTYKADLLPEVNLNATLPNYKNRYSLYPQDDGSYLFNKENNLQIDGELSIDQNIWLTGGSLS